MERLPAHVLDIPKQLELVQACTTATQYNKLIQANFGCSKEWLFEMASYNDVPQSSESTQEYYRFLGMVGVVMARFVFPALVFGLSTSGTYIKDIPLGNPRRQLALASHIGKIDQIVYPRKEEIFNDTWKSHGNEAFGAYGLFFRTRKGEITEQKINHKDEKHAVARFKEKSPIFLPHPAMSKALASLAFSLDDARYMSDQEFETQVLPRVGVIFEGIIDPIKVFVPNHGIQPRKIFT